MERLIVNKFSLMFNHGIKFHHNGCRTMYIHYDELISNSTKFRVPHMDNFYVYRNFHRRMKMSGKVEFE